MHLWVLLPSDRRLCLVGCSIRRDLLSDLDATELLLLRLRRYISVIEGRVGSYGLLDDARMPATVLLHLSVLSVGRYRLSPS